MCKAGPRQMQQVQDIGVTCLLFSENNRSRTDKFALKGNIDTKTDSVQCVQFRPDNSASHNCDQYVSEYTRLSCTEVKTQLICLRLLLLYHRSGILYSVNSHLTSESIFCQRLSSIKTCTIFGIWRPEFVHISALGPGWDIIFHFLARFLTQENSNEIA